MKVRESKIIAKDIILQKQPGQPEPCCRENLDPEQLSASDQELIEVVQSIFPTPTVPSSLTESILERIRSKTAPSS